MIPQNLSDLEHFRNDKRVQFKEERVAGVDVVIPCYMIADAEFWNLPYARELRGHTYFKDTGDLIGVAFHKFFNVGEREETHHHNIDWENIEPYTFDKMDGSMINAVVINDCVYFKTKKSFYSDVAQEFTHWFWKQSQCYEWAKDIVKLAGNSFSPIFEFYHPDWQVVLDYGKEPRVWHLNTRCMYSGGYFDGLVPQMFYGLPRASIEVWDIKNLMNYRHQTVEGVEGWIAYDFDKKEFYKIKTEWYLRNHRARTMLRERDVALMAAEETLDDVKSIISDAKLPLDKIEAIEKRVSNHICEVRECVEANVKDGHMYEFLPKDMVGYITKDHPYFGLIMRAFNGKDVDYVEYFKKNILKKRYGLKNLYNERF